MPLYRRLPKRGFNNIFAKNFAVFNLDDLQKHVDSKKLDAKVVVSEASLREAGLLKGRYDGIRILARGEIKAKLNIEAAGASKAAQEAVEKAGGKITIVAAKPAPAEKAADA